MSVIPRAVCRLLTTALVLGATGAAPAEELSRHHLFKIERNKNANIVQYDVQLGEDGKLHPKKPVVVYWIRLAKDGEERDLSWVQRRFAYGFTAKLDRQSDTVELDMVAEIGRPIMVGKVGDVYRASTRIGDDTCYLEKMYIHSTGKGMSTKVNYTDFHGTAVDSGETCFEKLEP